MSNEITPSDSGVSVFGVKQMDFMLADGKKVDFGTVLNDASIKQAMTVEQNANAVAGAVKMRMRKLEDLGKILAVVSEALAKYKTDTPESTDTVEVKVGTDGENGFKEMQAKLKKYGFTMDFGSGTKEVKDGCKHKTVEDNTVLTLQRGTAMKAQSALQQMMDREDNDLQQDKVTLQGFISKTNKSYQAVGDMMSKIGKSSAKVIGNIGG